MWQPSKEGTSVINYQRADVAGVNIFYREAGVGNGPTILLLHGFPTSGHMFRNLIPLLAHEYHVVAPDFPGFGQSDMPPRHEFPYTFENIAKVMGDFVDIMRYEKFAIYVFDYGSPVGLRLALSKPDAITTIISQNGNAYEVGLSDGWNPIRAYWKDPSDANRAALRSLLTPATTYWQYTHGVRDLSLVSPDGFSLDDFYLSRLGNDEVQLDLFLDYANNVAMYPTFQEYFRKYQPPLLAVWGKNDPFFLPPGAEAFKRDIPSAVVQFVDSGHFALETHCVEIAAAIKGFRPLTKLREM
jgi:pimeloyl-ACP methyl ester carboxylesterase